MSQHNEVILKGFFLILILSIPFVYPFTKGGAFIHRNHTLLLLPAMVAELCMGHYKSKYFEISWKIMSAISVSEKDSGEPDEKCNSWQ